MAHFGAPRVGLWAVAGFVDIIFVGTSCAGVLAAI